jgi:hypothetical protein
LKRARERAYGAVDKDAYEVEGEGVGIETREKRKEKRHRLMLNGALTRAFEPSVRTP